jgi:hypothetical protein
LTGARYRGTAGPPPPAPPTAHCHAGPPGTDPFYSPLAPRSAGAPGRPACLAARLPFASLSFVGLLGDVAVVRLPATGRSVVVRRGTCLGQEGVRVVGFQAGRLLVERKTDRGVSRAEWP